MADLRANRTSELSRDIDTVDVTSANETAIAQLRRIAAWCPVIAELFPETCDVMTSFQTVHRLQPRCR